MRHDQRWKLVLWKFFAEFMELFFPDVAEKLNFEGIKLVDKELFTDLPEGSRREPDLIVEAHTKDGESEIVLVHIEIQAAREQNVPRRMWEYYCLLRLRLKLPVFPIVVYLAKGTGGIVREEYVEAIFGQAISTFRYSAIGLPDLSADEYLEKGNALSPALSALMQSETMDRVRRKFRALERLMQSNVDDAGRWLLVDVVERYLELTPPESEEVNEMVKGLKTLDSEEYITIWEERAFRKGRKQGKVEGREEGREEGIAQGKRDTLLRQLRHRFGELPEGVVAQIERIENPGELDALIDRALEARSLMEMGLMEG